VRAEVIVAVEASSYSPAEIGARQLRHAEHVAIEGETWLATA
jgi:hypothetical protein